MQPFTYNALPARVVFGWGTSAQVAAEVKALRCSRAMVLTTPFQAGLGEELKQLLGELCVATYTNATMHTPLSVTREALAVAENSSVDCVVAVGGGSTIGLGKALALHTDGRIKQIAIPTTYAGSEATPIIGQSDTDDAGETTKTTQKSMNVLPATIIYDVNYTLTLPAQMTVTSGINSIAHAVEALYAPESNPIHSSLALQGISHIVEAIPKIMLDAQDIEARAQALYGAWCGGTVLGAVGMGLHHKLCHTLGGSFGMPHAETHTVILPHAIAYNQPYAQEAIARVAEALSVKSAAMGLFDLAKDNGAPYSLKALGFKETDIAKAAEIASRARYPNPAPMDEGRILTLLTNAYNGTRPM